jgi:uncharacterized protein with HEPN domain
MRELSAVPRLTDIIEAVQNIRVVTANVSLEEFEADWQKRWIVERGIEIVSEASRHLPEELKARHPEIPWSKVAAIGNILRHEYQRVAPAILWRVAQGELSPLESACKEELHRAQQNSA